MGKLTSIEGIFKEGFKFSIVFPLLNHVKGRRL